MFKSITVFSFLLCFSLLCKGQTVKSVLPKIYSLIIGVTPTATSKDERLMYTQSDATAFRDFLKSPSGGSVPEQNMTMLLGAQATRKNILHEVSRLFHNATKEDVVVFYFSGHGVTPDSGKDGFLVPYDYDPDYPSATGVPMYFIASQLSVSKAKMKQVYIDACHAGVFSSNENLKGSREEENTKIAAALRASLASSTGGYMAMLSSKGGEESREDPNLKRGIFTHFLLNGLAGDADEEKDGLVNMIELETYVVEQVRRYTNNAQHPVIIGNCRPDFPMAVNKLNASLKLLVKTNPGIVMQLKEEAVNAKKRQALMPQKRCKDGAKIFANSCSFTNKTTRTLVLYKAYTRTGGNVLGNCDCFNYKWQLTIPPGKTVNIPNRMQVSWMDADRTSMDYRFYFSNEQNGETQYAMLQYPIVACKDNEYTLTEDDFHFIPQAL